MAILQVTPSVQKIATDQQALAIFSMLCNPKLERLNIQVSGLGLPDDYLAFCQEWHEGGQPIYGGIDPQGVVST